MMSWSAAVAVCGPRAQRLAHTTTPGIRRDAFPAQRRDGSQRERRERKLRSRHADLHNLLSI